MRHVLLALRLRGAARSNRWKAKLSSRLEASRRDGGGTDGASQERRSAPKKHVVCCPPFGRIALNRVLITHQVMAVLVLLVTAALIGNLVGAAPAHAWSPARLTDLYGFSCLDADRNHWATRARVQAWKCNGWSNQDWWAEYGVHFRSQIRTPGPPAGPAKCLHGWLHDSDQVQVWDCHTYADGSPVTWQLWDIVPIGEGKFHIKSVGWDRCITIRRDWIIIPDGLAVTLETCNLSWDDQAWVIR
jgi:hypothetical protein